MNRIRSVRAIGSARLPRLPSRRLISASSSNLPPPNAPKPILDLKSIRQNPELYSQNCIDRNYAAFSSFPQRIAELHEQGQESTGEANVVRKSIKELQKDFKAGGKKDEIQKQMKELSEKLKGMERDIAAVEREQEELAIQIPNLTGENTPLGEEPMLLSYINEPSDPEAVLNNPANGSISHVEIGTKLGILDFASAGTTSGWGWYYLLGHGATLEQALVQYAMSVATKHGWLQVSPPSMVYSHIGTACGFSPRDAGGEQQVYQIVQSPKDEERGVPGMSLAGTSEIALAGMEAKKTLTMGELPKKRVAVSRCYRAEAGARGRDTRGLYRVHEFTKVELFAWTAPDQFETEDVFEEMVDIQTEILTGLGLYTRILEMPSTDLGASAARKVDMESFFPSRVSEKDATPGESGWGEVSSASICTDYQSRRLGTRVKGADGKLGFPWTVNGTGMAVPRVLAALLEVGWDGEGVVVPEVLRPYMNGLERIE